ncbi:hypothetical protein L1887_14745 [Cichorium endivia]|nr:hypothetical protein L1887_14745 [Cichorium endivia]
MTAVHSMTATQNHQQRTGEVEEPLHSTSQPISTIALGSTLEDFRVSRSYLNRMILITHDSLTNTFPRTGAEHGENTSSLLYVI